MNLSHGIILLLIGCLWSTQLQADAGFNIRRKQATVRVEFEGVSHLNDYRLVYYRWTTRYQDELPPTINRDVLDTISEETIVSVNNAQRFFDESIRDARFGLVDAQGNWVDSFALYLKDFNYRARIKGVQQSRLQYQLDSTPVVFEYALWDGDATGDAAYNRNRWIFIGMSFIGLILLVAYSFRTRHRTSQSSNQP